jgi:hypothetical protein
MANPETVSTNVTKRKRSFFIGIFQLMAFCIQIDEEKRERYSPYFAVFSAIIAILTGDQQKERIKSRACRKKPTCAFLVLCPKRRMMHW